MIGGAVINTRAMAGARLQAFKAFRHRCEVRALADLYPEKKGGPG
jgi:hypothetical protein